LIKSVKHSLCLDHVGMRNGKRSWMSVRPDRRQVVLGAWTCPLRRRSGSWWRQVETRIVVTVSVSFGNSVLGWNPTRRRTFAIRWCHVAGRRRRCLPGLLPTSWWSRPVKHFKIVLWLLKVAWLLIILKINNLIQLFLTEAPWQTCVS